MAAADVAAPAKASYTFASEPRAVQNRKKYREPNEPAPPSNIMFDKRVVRGNTYASQLLPTTTQPDLSKSTTKKDSTQTRKMRTMRDTTNMQQTPDPVEGRKHIDVQTENYLEELADRVPEQDADTQTDLFMDRPPTPLFVPKKTGVDAQTQIEDGDLFNFDLEVEPILEVLVGKVLEQSMMEVLEEEELSAIRAHQDEFDQIRHAELAEVQRMEAAERRRYEEKERRLAQERARLAREKQVREKVAATMYSKNYVRDLVAGVFDGLADAGFFYDPVVKEVEDAFMPWLTERAVEKIEKKAATQALVDDVIKRALALGPERRAADRQRIREEEERRIAEELRKKQEEEDRIRREEEERLAAERAAEEAEQAEAEGEGVEGGEAPAEESS
eukprot:tig00020964_g16795.t1